jgi:hypothetical protein
MDLHGLAGALSNMMDANGLFAALTKGNGHGLDHSVVHKGED